MGRESESPKVVRHSSLTEYFRHEVHAAVRATSVEARSETVSYLADLMARFARTDRLFERTPDGVTLKPLAECYAGAVRSESATQRHRALRELGDLALFIAGVLPDCLRRRTVGLIANRRIPPSAATRTVVEVLRQIVSDELRHRPGIHSPAVARIRRLDPASVPE